MKKASQTKRVDIQKDPSLSLWSVAMAAWKDFCGPFEANGFSIFNNWIRVKGWAGFCHTLKAFLLLSLLLSAIRVGYKNQEGLIIMNERCNLNLNTNWHPKRILSSLGLPHIHPLQLIIKNTIPFCIWIKWSSFFD